MLWHVDGPSTGRGIIRSDCEDLVEDIEDGDESFLDELPKDVSQDFTEGPSTYMYLDDDSSIWVRHWNVQIP